MLADDIEAGGGSDEAVALALGWYPLNAGGEWCGPGEKGGYSMFGPPAFLTDLNALAAECERRGICIDRCVSNSGTGGFYYIIELAAERGHGAAKTFARALCAALVRAVEASNGR